MTKRYGKVKFYRWFDALVDLHESLPVEATGDESRMIERQVGGETAGNSTEEGERQ